MRTRTLQYKINRDIIRKKRIENGLCADCGKNPLVTTTLCQFCRERKINWNKRPEVKIKINEKNRERVAALVAAGKCSQCETPNNNGKETCETCLEKTRELRRKPHHRFTASKTAARRYGLIWELSKEEFFVLIAQSCHYCYKGLNECGSSLDKKDPALGYVLSNVVPCCTRCNRVKGDHFTYEEMVNIIAPAVRAVDSLKEKD